MQVTGESSFISVRDGQKSDGTKWYMAKFLDENADEFFTAFIEKELYQELQGMEKKTPVILTMNLVPGQKYFSIESIEIALQ